MNPAVQGYAAAVLEEVGPQDRSSLAAELAEVEREVSGNADLRSAMSDAAVPAPARRAVIEELLEGRVSPAARRLAGYAAGSVHSQEVVSTVAWVANRARLAAEGLVQEEPLLGHRAARTRVGGFAAAVFEELSVGDLEEVEDQLFRFARTVDATPELRGALGDRDLPSTVRRAVVDELLDGRVLPATKRLVGYAVAGGRPRDIVGTLEWLVEQAAEARGWRVARVRAGQEVEAEERSKLEAMLSRLAGSPVELQVTVDPALLAGVSVEIGDLRIDGTARGRLERLREHVVTGGWQDRGFGRTEREAHASADAQDGTQATSSEGAH